MLSQLFSKSKDLSDMLRFLPGVIVLDGMRMQGKIDLYLSGFLRDQDRSQLYYSDPMLQHISICRHFLSLLDRSNSFRVNIQS